MLFRSERFRRDLKKAGVAYVDSLGRFGDFHSLRYTFCTNMQNSNIPSRVAMTLMRHRDRRQTDSIYTDENLLSTVQAIKVLPSYLGKTSGETSETSDTNRPIEALPVTDATRGDVEQPIENKGDSRALARSDAPCREVELAGATGLEPAPKSMPA